MITFPIDAAFTHNDGVTYLTQQSAIYQWNSTAGPYDRLPNGRRSQGWPRRIPEVISGIPAIIDTAFNWKYDKRTYFFKDAFFYIWDASLIKAVGPYGIEQWTDVCKINICRIVKGKQVCVDN